VRKVGAILTGGAHFFACICCGAGVDILSCHQYNTTGSECENINRVVLAQFDRLEVGIWRPAAWLRCYSPLDLEFCWKLLYCIANRELHFGCSKIILAEIQF
jgi:hypothetical protein